MTLPGLEAGRCFIIGEVGLAHDGSLGYAHAFIDEVARGRRRRGEVSDAHCRGGEHARRAVPREVQPAGRVPIRLLEADGIHRGQWQGLAGPRARAAGSCSSARRSPIEAVDLLTRVGMSMWKVPSGEVGNVALLDAMIATGRPILLSSGMSEIARAGRGRRARARAGLPLAVLQCTTAYPCPPERIGLNMIPFFRERYSCFVGLSDHSGTIYPGIAAAALGSEVLEVHVTMSRGMFGPDVPASVTIEELRAARRRRPVRRADAREPGGQGCRCAPTWRRCARSSPRAWWRETPLAAGTVLTGAHLAMKKPGTGIPAGRMSESHRADAAPRPRSRRGDSRRGPRLGAEAVRMSKTSDLRGRHRAAQLLAHPHRPSGD